MLAATKSSATISMENTVGKNSAREANRQKIANLQNQPEFAEMLITIKGIYKTLYYRDKPKNINKHTGVDEPIRVQSEATPK